MKAAYGAIIALIGIAVVASGIGVFLSDWDRPPLDAEQYGYRGLAMEAVTNPRTAAVQAALNQAPEPPYELDGIDDPKAWEVYDNVPLLGDLSQESFDRLMAAITEWVAPEEESCNYCHNPEDLASDEVYTKDVARRMLEMTLHINENWDAHVGAVGVTCYTCHRGEPVPTEVWHVNPGPPQARGMAASREGQNLAAASVGVTSLPYDPFASMLAGDTEIRVVGETALPVSLAIGTKQTEVTYGLMMHLSTALGVNCTHCHNSRSFAAWDQSSPLRTTAWHGIRMLRELNNDYIEPLQPMFPPERLGPLGDTLKANCATCHHGQPKPLGGAPMVADYPTLQGPAQAVEASQ